MKNLIIYLGLILLNLLSFQTYAQITLVSKSDALGNCAAMKITQVNDTIFINRYQVECMEGVLPTLFNLSTNLVIDTVDINSFTFSAPNDGRIYTYIPFNNNEDTLVLRPYATFCVECFCIDNYDCVFYFGSGFGCSGCASGGGCEMMLYPCEGGFRQIYGGGVIVSAAKVILIE